MTDELAIKIDSFLRLSERCGEPLTDYAFGFKAVRNGRLLERLRAGGDVTRRTERRVLDFISKETNKFLSNSSDTGKNTS